MYALRTAIGHYALCSELRGGRVSSATPRHGRLADTSPHACCGSAWSGGAERERRGGRVWPG
eukprot:scaffold126537_cov30-Tisochrysis_lutea.AAC.7